MVVSKHNISIASWNIDGAFRTISGTRHCKLDEPDVSLSLGKFDLICLVETHASPSDSLSLPGYHFHHAPIRPKHPNAPWHSGGIAIGINNSISKGVSIIKTNSTEVMWMKLDRKFFNLTSDMYVASVYVAPNDSPYFQTYDNIFDLLESDVAKFSKNGNCFLAGDWNSRTNITNDFCSNFTPPDGTKIFCDTIPPVRSNLDEKPIDHHGNLLLDLCKSSGLRLLNGRILGDLEGKFTCFSHAAKVPSTIDYMLTSADCLKMVDYFQVSDLTVHSIHCIISAVLVTGIYEPCDEKVPLKRLDKFLWRSNDSAKFLETLSTPLFSSKLDDLAKSATPSCNHISDLTDILIKAAEMSKIRKSSKSKKKRRKHKRWFDSDCHKLKNELRKIARRIGSLTANDYKRGDTLHKIYNQKKKHYYKVLKRKSNQYKAETLNELEALHSSNPRAYWQLFDQLRDHDSKKSVCPASSESLISHFRNLANTVSDKQDTNFEASLDAFIDENRNSIFNELNFSISADEISESIDKLKLNKASGTDLILNEMLKSGKLILLPVLHKLFNNIYNFRLFPKAWCCSPLTPVYKKGDRTLAKNYRGIAVSSNLCKLYCSVLNNRLTKFCDLNNLLPSSQIGYRKNSRPSDHVFVLKSLIDKYLIDKKQWLYTCFVDFKAAFPSLSRRAILFKLIKAGICGNFIDAIEDLYSTVSYCVKIGSDISDTFPSVVGVKQGCVLSPLLFNLFVRDLPDIIDESCDPVTLWDMKLPCLQFADDLVLLSQSQSGLQNSINKLSEYCAKWSLNINMDKTKILIFNSSGRTIKSQRFFLDGLILENVHSYCYLGIVFTAFGSFSEAASRLFDQANKALFKLKQFNVHQNVPVALKLFESLISPILSYSSDIWAVFCLGNLNSSSDLFDLCENLPVEKLVLKFAKYLLRVPKNATTAAVRGELALYPILCKFFVSILSNWQRIVSSDPSSLIRKSYLEYCNRLFLTPNLKKCNYAKCIRETLLYFDHDEVWFNQTFKRKSSIKRSFKKTVLSKYESAWFVELNRKDKLRTYRKFKSEFKLEPYLSLVSFCSRNKLTKFRISAHRLEIEVGRHRRRNGNLIPEDQRICLKCSSGEVENEVHAILDCSAHEAIRASVFNSLCNFTNFDSLSREEKFILICNLNDSEIIKVVLPLFQSIMYIPVH